MNDQSSRSIVYEAFMAHFAALMAFADRENDNVLAAKLEDALDVFKARFEKTVD